MFSDSEGESDELLFPNSEGKKASVKKNERDRSRSPRRAPRAPKKPESAEKKKGGKAASSAGGRKRTTAKYQSQDRWEDLIETW